MDLMNSLMQAMTSDDALNALTKKSGASGDQVSSLLSQAIPALMQQMQSNASTEQGAASLLNALGQHTSTATVSQQIADADEIDGGKILGHILGSDKTSAIAALAGAAGIDAKQATSVLSNVAPALLNSLSATAGGAKKKKGFDLSDGLDVNDVMALLDSGSGNSSGLDVGSLLGSLGKIFK